MSASNLFDDLEGDDDIFYTPAKTPPKKKKQWMDDLLDDDKDLFGDITVDKKETVAVVAAGKETLEETEAKKPKSGGGLFDDLPLDDAPLSTSDGQASNGVNGYKDEEFVVVSHDEVPSQEEAERTANPPPETDTTEAEHDGPNSDLFNQNVGYEERARIRREQRRKRAEEKERSSKTPSPTSPPLDDTKQDRDKRSTTPSPSPGIEETTQVFSGSSKSQFPIPVEPRVEKADSSTPTPEPPAQQPKDDSSEQIWQLTKSLERAQSENGYLKSENERLSGQVKTLQDKVAQLEKQLADRDKKEEIDSADNKKQVANLQEQLKSKDKEIEELRAVLKKSESPHHASVTTVVSVKKTPNSPRTKLRAGVDKGRPITSVADSVKKFGGAGATEVKRTPVPPKPKQSSPAHVKPDDKHTTAKKPSVPFHSKPSPPSKPRATVHHDKPDAHPSKHSHAHHPHPSAKDHTHHPHPHPHPHHTPHGHHPHPHKPEPANRSAKVTHKKPHPHHHAHSHATTSDKKESEKQDKKMEEEKKTEEVTVTKEEPKPEPVAPPADAEPPSEPKPEAPAAEVKPSEKKEEETTIQQLEKDTTRAQRVISLFENKGTSKPEQEQAPAWKMNAQQQRTAKDKEEREKETARQKVQEQEEKEKQEVEEKSRTSSNASSHKDEVIVNGSVETTTAESANDEKEVRTPETDGGIITKPKTVASASSNVTKSTSALPPATKNTSNKNEEIKIRDNKMKKTGSASTIIPDPKKRLMVEEKGKRTSWAAPKREECAVCNKVVYVMERLEADKVVYHKTCFKCTVCNKTLSTGTYAALQGKTYCKVHFKQLFKMKGNYDEGFGREQHKTKWIKKDGETEA